MQLNKRFTPSREKASSRAFTLLEIMIATGILGCALIALLTTVNQAHKMNQKAVALLEQSLLAKTKIEEILLLEDLSSSSSGNGQFENSPRCSYSFSTSEFTLPFSESISSKESNILEISLVIKDERTPDSDYEITTYAFKKTQ
jgi:type II secretory pathway pseudopilin PulG